MAKVDIVIPCYNYARYLEVCLRSVTDQSLQDLRVLIIDDASSDGSLLTARKLAQSDPRIEVAAHRENWGHIRTYNQGIEWASADYFLLLSADDLLAPGALSRAVQIMDRHPEVVLTHGKGLDWYDHLPLPHLAESQDFEWRRQDLVRATCARGANLVCTPTAIVRTSVQKKVGGYRPALPHSGDMEMWLRLAAHGPVASIDKTTQAIYRKHSSNMSNSYFSGKLPDFRERKRAIDSFFEEYKTQIFRWRDLQAQAYRMLAKEVYWSGIAQICRGRSSNGRQLLSFCFELSPKLRYFPPLARLTKTPHIRRSLASIAGEAAGSIFGRITQ